jgi:hypothetical protein
MDGNQQNPELIVGQHHGDLRHPGQLGEDFGVARLADAGRSQPGAVRRSGTWSGLSGSDQPRGQKPEYLAKS